MTLYRLAYLTIVGVVGALWLAPFCFVLWKLFGCNSPNVGYSLTCLAENLSTAMVAGFFSALGNSAIIGITSAIITLMVVIGLLQGGLTASKSWFHILGPAIGLRCIPPIALLISHFVLIEFAEYYWPTFQRSIWLIVGFHALSALPLALLIVLPRINVLHGSDANEGGLFDLARLDGASGGVYFTLILLPNLWSEFLLAGLVALSISWSEALYAGVFQEGPATWTIPVFIGAFETSYEIAWAQLFATLSASIFVLIGLAIVSVRLINSRLHTEP